MIPTPECLDSIQQKKRISSLDDANTMKTVLVIPDGVADEPQQLLDGQTPLQAAQIPNMDLVARRGIVGRTNNVPTSMPSGSDVGTMSLFGYSPLEFHTGRAPLEASAQGIELQPGDWAIRCNLVTIRDQVMTSFTAGQFPGSDARALLELLQRESCGDPHWKFHPGVSYRNLLVYRTRGESAPFGDDLKTVPPHDITDQRIEPYLPKGTGAEHLLKLMQRSQELFAGSEINHRRSRQDELPATGIWLWGQGQRPDLPLFQKRFGARGAVITAVDLLRGIGRLIGWQTIEVEGATGYLDTNYAAKGQAAIQALTDPDLDFLVVHVEATDEASHEGSVEEKVHAVEQIDQHIVGPIHRWLEGQGDYRLLICPDHPTFLRTRTHSHGDCPFTVCGSGISPDAAVTYSEITAGDAEVCFASGWDLMPWLMAAQSVH